MGTNFDAEKVGKAKGDAGRARLAVEQAALCGQALVGGMKDAPEAVKAGKAS